MEYIELGPVPPGEPCAQVGTDGYLANSLRECKVYRRMLARAFPIPEGLPIKYVVRSHPHDFGPYREVSIAFAGRDPAAVEFAYRVESGMPDCWDSVSIQELAHLRRHADHEADRARSPDDREAPCLHAHSALPRLPAKARHADLPASTAA